MTPPPSPPISQNLASLGLGYAIAIAFAFLVLLSTILLASYVCCRATRQRNTTNTATFNNTAAAAAAAGGVIVPRFIFVAEDDDDDEESGNSSSTVVGLHQAVINSYPKFPFSKPKPGSTAGDASSCSICLCDYREAEMLRMMPDCKHFFHLPCLDAWLRLNGSCPVCRSSPLPTPISTPLAEVVPLSQYAADRTRTRTALASASL
uniref:RING-type domain-containing protein n=1 Tax=Kalanchoe fedtschenkoi TaxID=63787 RepID=A0A7N0ZUX2_KALFE